MINYLIHPWTSPDVGLLYYGAVLGACTVIIHLRCLVSNLQTFDVFSTTVISWEFVMVFTRRNCPKCLWSTTSLLGVIFWVLLIVHVSVL